MSAAIVLMVMLMGGTLLEKMPARVQAATPRTHPHSVIVFPSLPWGIGVSWRYQNEPHCGIVASSTTNCNMTQYQATGIDFDTAGDAAGANTTIVSIADGTVIYNRKDVPDSASGDGYCSGSPGPIYNNEVIIQTGNIKVWYAHLAANSIPNEITDGAHVSAGQVIGSEGATGCTVPGGYNHLWLGFSYASGGFFNPYGSLTMGRWSLGADGVFTHNPGGQVAKQAACYYTPPGNNCGPPDLMVNDSKGITTTITGPPTTPQGAQASTDASTIATSLGQSVAQVLTGIITNVLSFVIGLLTVTADFSDAGTWPELNTFFSSMQTVALSLWFCLFLVALLRYWLTSIGADNMSDALAGVRRGVGGMILLLLLPSALHWWFPIVNAVAGQINAAGSNVLNQNLTNGLTALNNAGGPMGGGLVATLIVVILAIFFLVAILIVGIVRIGGLFLLASFYAMGPLCVACWVSPDFKRIGTWWFENFAGYSFWGVGYAVAFKVLGVMVVSLPHDPVNGGLFASVLLQPVIALAGIVVLFQVPRIVGAAMGGAVHGDAGAFLQQAATTAIKAAVTGGA